MRDLLFPLDPAEPGTLQARVRRRLLQAIEQGDLVAAVKAILLATLLEVLGL